MLVVGNRWSVEGYQVESDGCQHAGILASTLLSANHERHPVAETAKKIRFRIELSLAQAIHKSWHIPQSCLTGLKTIARSQLHDLSQHAGFNAFRHCCLHDHVCVYIYMYIYIDTIMIRIGTYRAHTQIMAYTGLKCAQVKRAASFNKTSP